jgi:hypothetical protein
MAGEIEVKAAGNLRVWVWGCILGLTLLCALHAQESTRDLRIEAEDTCLENHEDPGLHLFIRKKPDIASVMLTESTGEDAYGYRSPEWNTVNGDEPYFDASGEGRRWFLVDSSPEPHPLLGEAFHIYIPPVLVYGPEGGPQETVPIAEGVYINIRTFALPSGDWSEGFADNPFPFVLGYLSSPESPAPPSALPPGEAVLSMPVDPETIKLMEEIRDLLKKEEASPPSDPEEEPFVFAPLIEGRFGLRMFLPGPDGILLPSLQLQNEYNPVGTITLTQQINKTLGFTLELDRDSLSLNRIIARAGWDTGIVGIEAGPYMGILNSETGNISPGLSMVLHLRLPEWNLSGFFRLDSALGREPAGPGDYTLSYTSTAVSYAFPWLKLTLGMVERGSTELDNRQILRVGRWIRYNLAAEFPLAHTPWDFRVEAGYEQLQWNYKLFMPLEYRYSAVYTGLEASYVVLPNFLTLIAGLEGPVYPFVYPAIQSLDDPQAAFYARATLGFRLTPGR